MSSVFISCAVKLAKSWLQHTCVTIQIRSGESATAERLDAVLFPREALQRFVLAARAGHLEAPDVSIGLLDDRQEPIFGAAAPGAIRATCNLSVVQVPWQLSVERVGGTGSYLTSRARYLIPTLVLVVAAVGSACYAMSRGVLREWQTRQLQSEFVSAVSHEFRSPLTTLGQLTELLA